MQRTNLNSNDLDAVKLLVMLQSKGLKSSILGIEEQKKDEKSKCQRKSRSRDQELNIPKLRSKSESNKSAILHKEMAKKFDKKSPNVDENCSESDSEEEEIELIRRRRNRSDIKLMKGRTLSDENNIDFSKHLHLMTKELHGEQIKLDESSVQLLNDYLNDMTKKLLTNSKDLMLKLSKQSRGRKRMTAWDIKSSVELLLGYGNSQANNIQLYATAALLKHRSYSLISSSKASKKVKFAY